MSYVRKRQARCGSPEHAGAGTGNRLSNDRAVPGAGWRLRHISVYIVRSGVFHDALNGGPFQLG